MFKNTTSLWIFCICDYFYNKASIDLYYYFWSIVAQSLVQTSFKITLLNGSLKLSKLPLFKTMCMFHRYVSWQSAYAALNRHSNINEQFFKTKAIAES